MKVRELIEKLNKLKKEGYITVACDEELNTIFNDFEIEELGTEPIDEKPVYVIFGLSGSERGE